MVGQAVPSVAPGLAALHFRKTECFCFTEQRFAPGEWRDMPLVFMVDKDLPEDITTLTLAYTFFDKQILVD
jgi:cytochrome c oxidase assembly protein subunit 11